LNRLSSARALAVLKKEKNRRAIIKIDLDEGMRGFLIKHPLIGYTSCL
jgi:hypothetical protein